jgi:hypothetical protein
MYSKLRIATAALAAAAIFCGGTLFGARQAAPGGAGRNKFGMPKTVIHVVSFKWKADVPEAEKQKALDGVREMAAKIPGIKNIWMKSTRVQPRDYDAAFVIEFKGRDAADDYAENPVHAEWAKHYVSIREESRSLQITNE